MKTTEDIILYLQAASNCGKEREDDLMDNVEYFMKKLDHPRAEQYLNWYNRNDDYTRLLGDILSWIEDDEGPANFREEYEKLKER